MFNKKHLDKLKYTLANIDCKHIMGIINEILYANKTINIQKGDKILVNELVIKIIIRKLGVEILLIKSLRDQLLIKLLINIFEENYQNYNL